MKTILIVNPKAGRSFFLNLHLPQVIKLLERHEVSFRVFYTRYSGHAAKLVRRYRDEIDCVTVFGGDGTIREVVKGMGTRPLPIGIIPFGTVNVLALDLGISLNPVIATTSILAGHTRRIDVGYLNSEPFLLMVSTGLDAMAVHTVDLRFKRYLGQMSYVLGMIWSALTDRARRIQITIEEKNITDRGYLAIVSNSRYYAGPYTLAEEVRIDNGILNVILFKKSSILDTFGLLECTDQQAPHEAGRVFLLGEGDPHTRQQTDQDADGRRQGTIPARPDLRAGAIPACVRARGGEEARGRHNRKGVPHGHRRRKQPGQALC